MSIRSLLGRQVGALNTELQLEALRKAKEEQRGKALNEALKTVIGAGFALDDQRKQDAALAAQGQLLQLERSNYAKENKELQNELPDSLLVYAPTPATAPAAATARVTSAELPKQQSPKELINPKAYSKLGFPLQTPEEKKKEELENKVAEKALVAPKDNKPLPNVEIKSVGEPKKRELKQPLPQEVQIRLQQGEAPPMLDEDLAMDPAQIKGRVATPYNQKQERPEIERRSLIKPPSRFDAKDDTFGIPEDLPLPGISFGARGRGRDTTQPSSREAALEGKSGAQSDVGYAYVERPRFEGTPLEFINRSELLTKLFNPELAQANLEKKNLDKSGLRKEEKKLPAFDQAGNPLLDNQSKSRLNNLSKDSSRLQNDPKTFLERFNKIALDYANKSGLDFDVAKGMLTTQYIDLKKNTKEKDNTLELLKLEQRKQELNSVGTQREFNIFTRALNPEKDLNEFAKLKDSEFSDFGEYLAREYYDNAGYTFLTREQAKNSAFSAMYDRLIKADMNEAKKADMIGRLRVAQAKLGLTSRELGIRQAELAEKREERFDAAAQKQLDDNEIDKDIAKALMGIDQIDLAYDDIINLAIQYGLDTGTFEGPFSVIKAQILDGTPFAILNQRLKEVYNPTLKERSGSSVTGQEQQRLLDELPNINDDSKTFMAKLKQAKKANLENKARLQSIATPAQRKLSGSKLLEQIDGAKKLEQEKNKIKSTKVQGRQEYEKSKQPATPPAPAAPPVKKSPPPKPGETIDQYIDRTGQMPDDDTLTKLKQ